MNNKQIIALWLYNRRRKRKRKNRIFWVHSINARREGVGLFYNLFNDLRNDENKFFSCFRMSRASFDVLYEKLKDKQHWSFFTRIIKNSTLNSAII
jgi:hypothetical protein